MFYEVSCVGEMAIGETIVNTWAFQEVGAPGETVSLAKCQTIGEAFLDLWEATITAAMVAEATFHTIRVVGYNSDGSKGAFPPAEIIITPFNGSAGNVRDGNFITFTISKRLGEGETLNVGGRIPKRGHWAVGPINNSMVGNQGDILVLGDQYTGLQSWVAMANAPLIIGGSEEVPPVVLSHTQTNILLPGGVEISDDVTGWAPVENAILRTFASNRNSRNNRR